jgi:hypothetical protein
MVVDQVICSRYIEAVSKKDRGVSFGDANGHCSSSKGSYNIGNLLREMKQGFAGGPVVEDNNDFLAPQIVPQGPVAGRDIPFEALSIDSMNTCCRIWQGHELYSGFDWNSHGLYASNRDDNWDNCRCSSRGGIGDNSGGCGSGMYSYRGNDGCSSKSGSRYSSRRNRRLSYRDSGGNWYSSSSALC